MASSELTAQIKDFLSEVYRKMECGGTATQTVSLQRNSEEGLDALERSRREANLERYIVNGSGYRGMWVRRNRESKIYDYFLDGHNATWEGLPVSVPAEPFPEENIDPNALEILKSRFPNGYRPSKAGHDMWAYYLFDSFAVVDRETHYEIDLTIRLVDGYNGREQYKDSLVLIPSESTFLIVSHSRKSAP